jgi:hypothetical protein
VARPPNDSKQRRPARAPKRTGQANASPRGNPPTSRTNVVTFPVADLPRAEADADPSLPEIQHALETTISLTPLQLLAMILKAKLGDRIKDEEVQRICQVYYTGLALIWGDEEE